MRISQRKKHSCQNCQYPLTDNYNFCPNCGQENSEKLVAFSTLVSEFFSNYIAYDSRLVRTIWPFLFKPGYLTNAFIEGKRVRYMHPLRLYFIVSFFYFFALTLAFKQNTNTAVYNTNTSRSTTQETETDRPEGINITLNPDSLTKENNNEIFIFNRSFSMDFLKDPRTTEAQVVDSLGWQQTLINQYVVKQIIKFTRSDSKSIGAYFSDFMLSKGSILMFFMLPVFALLLKFAYLRQKRFYVEHLTFSLHIHAFAFFILFVQLVFEKLFMIEWIGNIAFILIMVYGLVAAIKVYRQKWIKTLIKGFLLLFAYGICLSIVALIAIIIAGLIY